MTLPKDVVAKICEDLLRYSGVYKGNFSCLRDFKGGTQGNWLSVLSLVHIFSQISSFVYLTLTLLRSQNPFTMVTEFMALSTLYSGLYFSILRYREKFMLISKECELMPDIALPWISTEFENRRFQVLNTIFAKSLVHFSRFLMILTVYAIFAYTIFNFFIGEPPELPLSGKYDGSIVFWFYFSFQAVFITTGGIACVTVTQLIGFVGLHIKVHYEILSLVMHNYRETDSFHGVLQQCVEHHKKMLGILKVVQEIYSSVFFFIYFGLFTALSVSRSLLIGENRDLKVLPILIGEVLFIFPFSYVMEIIVEENEKFRFSIYESRWLTFSKKLNQNLSIIMAKTLQNPSIVLYAGGSPFNMRTFGLVINSTCTFFLTSMLFYITKQIKST